VQQVLSQQLDESDNEAVLAELQALEDAALEEEVAAMPSVPASEQQQQEVAQQPAAAAEAEELPSVPKTKVGVRVRSCGVGCGPCHCQRHARLNVCTMPLAERRVLVLSCVQVPAAAAAPGEGEAKQRQLEPMLAA
jgi:hypothetical protein